MNAKDKTSLLLFLETQIVDHSGRVGGIHMNHQDFQQAHKWHEENFIGFGQIISRDCNDYGSMWVTFSDAAWEKAHHARRARGERSIKNRPYETTAEKRERVSCNKP